MASRGLARAVRRARGGALAPSAVLAGAAPARELSECCGWVLPPYCAGLLPLRAVWLASSRRLRRRSLYPPPRTFARSLVASHPPSLPSRPAGLLSSPLLAQLLIRLPKGAL